MCVGGYLFITSVVGLSGADFAPRCLCGVDAHRHMLLVAALAQLAVFLALSLSPGADGDALAGLDVTGAEAKLARAVRAHRPLARGVSLAVFALQLADLALASALARARAPPAPEPLSRGTPPSSLWHSPLLLAALAGSLRSSSGLAPP